MRGFLSLVFMISSFGSYCQSASIVVVVKDIREAKGSVLVGIYTSKKDFLEKPAMGRSVKVVGPEVVLAFDNLPEGEYAVSIIHDENDNKELDRNKLGLPQEGYCFSNNVFGRLGPPSYDNVKIVLKGRSVRQTLTMKYHF